MNFKNKIIIIIVFCITISACSYFIIYTIHDRLESQLLEKCHVETLVGARVMSDILHNLAMNNIISRADLFDTDYVPVKGSSLKKFHTRYDTVLEGYIQKIEDEFLLDPDVSFAVLGDKNGYVPAHNSIYSKPETGNYTHDLAFSRSKRIFGDFPAIKNAIKYRGRGTTRNIYCSDTNELRVNFAAPVTLDEKHWGTFVIGVSMERLNILKNQMLIMIITVMLVILSMTMLAILAVIPKKILNTDFSSDKRY